MVIKRYLVFAYRCYYPGGGWSDFEASFDEFSDAIAMAKSIVTSSHDTPDVAEIIDTVSGQVFSSTYDYKAWLRSEYYEHNNGMVLGCKGDKRKYQDAGSWRNCENDPE